MRSKIANVIVPLKVNKTFDYFISPHVEAKRGMRVVVDFNGIKVIGIIKSISSTSSFPYA